MLEEREKQIRQMEREREDTKEQLKSLSLGVLEMEKVLQETSSTAKELAHKKEQLVVSLTSKQKRHEEMITCKQGTQKMDDYSKLAFELEQSIHDVRAQMERLDAESSQLDAKNSRLKNELAAKRKQAKECRQVVKSHDEHLSQLTAMLRAERKIFDLQVQLMKTSPDNISEEQAVSAIQVASLSNYYTCVMALMLFWWSGPLQYKVSLTHIYIAYVL